MRSSAPGELCQVRRSAVGEQVAKGGAGRRGSRRGSWPKPVKELDIFARGAEFGLFGTSSRRGGTVSGPSFHRLQAQGFGLFLSRCEHVNSVPILCI